MEGTKQESPRALALSMLLLGVIGHLAWLYLRFNRTREPYSDALVPGLVWLSTVSIACWAVLLVKPGWRRLGVGVLASLAAIVFVYVSETTAQRWFRPPRAERVGPSDRVPRPGEPLVLPAGLVDLDGHALDLAGYGDRPLVLNLWRTWCAPCRKEMPDLQRLDGRMTPLGALAVLGFSDEPTELQKDTRAELGIRFRLIAHEEELPALDAAAFPTTLVVHKGRVLGRWTGAKDDLAGAVDAVLEKEPSEPASTAAPPPPRTASPR